MHRKVKLVEPLENYTLKVEFADGCTEIIDIKPYINEFHAFKDLLIVDGLFEQVKVDSGGYGISWNDYIDLGF